MILKSCVILLFILNCSYSFVEELYSTSKKPICVCQNSPYGFLFLEYQAFSTLKNGDEGYHEFYFLPLFERNIFESAKDCLNYSKTQVCYYSKINQSKSTLYSQVNVEENCLLKVPYWDGQKVQKYDKACLENPSRMAKKHFVTALSSDLNEPISKYLKCVPRLEDRTPINKIESQINTLKARLRDLKGKKTVVSKDTLESFRYKKFIPMSKKSKLRRIAKKIYNSVELKEIKNKLKKVEDKIESLDSSISDVVLLHELQVSNFTLMYREAKRMDKQQRPERYRLNNLTVSKHLKKSKSIKLGKCEIVYDDKISDLPYRIFVDGKLYSTIQTRNNSSHNVFGNDPLSSSDIENTLFVDKNISRAFKEVYEIGKCKEKNDYVPYGSSLFASRGSFVTLSNDTRKFVVAMEDSLGKEFFDREENTFVDTKMSLDQWLDEMISMIRGMEDEMPNFMSSETFEKESRVLVKLMRLQKLYNTKIQEIKTSIIAHETHQIKREERDRLYKHNQLRQVSYQKMLERNKEKNNKFILKLDAEKKLDANILTLEKRVDFAEDELDQLMTLQNRCVDFENRVITETK